MQDFRHLKVWEKSHKLTLSIYKISLAFPREEVYGLTSQLRRSCMSIPTNIAEGCCRGTDAEFKQFIQISMGSASETEYQLLLARDLGYINEEVHNQLTNEITEIKQMLASLIKKLKAES